jgi:hypothetical protein
MMSPTSGIGTKLPIRDVRNPVAIGGKPDMARTAQFGRDGPKADVTNAARVRCCTPMAIATA